MKAKDLSLAPEEADLLSVWPGIEKLCDTEKSSFWGFGVEDGFVSLTYWKATSQVRIVHHGVSETVFMDFKRVPFARLPGLLKRLLTAYSAKKSKKEKGKPHDKAKESESPQTPETTEDEDRFVFTDVSVHLLQPRRH